MSKKKRIIKELSIFEISGVDKPAQEHAKITVVKNMKETDIMTEETNPKTDNVELEEAKQAITSLQESIQRLKFIDSLSNEAREFFKSLSEDNQKKYQDLGTSELEVKVKSINEGDEIVYKCLDGLEIRKSDGEIALKIAKENDLLKAEKAEAQKQIKLAGYKAVAESDLANLSGSIDIKTSLLALLDGTEIEADVIAMLKGANKASDEVFKASGVEIQTSLEEKSLNSLVKEYQAKNPGTTYSTALEIVSRTEEGKKAYLGIKEGKING